MLPNNREDDHDYAITSRSFWLHNGADMFAVIRTTNGDLKSCYPLQSRHLLDRNGIMSTFITILG